MSTIIDRVRREPALVSGLVAAVIGLGVSFGLELSKEQVGAIMALVVSILAFVTRRQVTPYVNVVERAVDGEVIAGPANDLEHEGMVVREIVEPLD